MPQRRYRAVNTLILWGAVIEKGFASQSWLTFRQALNLGGHVRRGETGTTVVYADRFVPKDEKARARETGDEPEAISFLKRFTLFNIDQCESLPEDLAAAAPPPPETLILPPAEALIRATGADEELCDRSKGREKVLPAARRGAAIMSHDTCEPANRDYDGYITRALATEGGHLSIGRGGFTLWYARGCREAGAEVFNVPAQAARAQGRSDC